MSRNFSPHSCCLAARSWELEHPAQFLSKELSGQHIYAEIDAVIYIGKSGNDFGIGFQTKVQMDTLHGVHVYNNVQNDRYNKQRKHCYDVCK